MATAFMIPKILSSLLTRTEATKASMFLGLPGSECLCLMVDADYPFQVLVPQTFYNTRAPHAPFSEALQDIMGHAFSRPAVR